MSFAFELEQARFAAEKAASYILQEYSSFVPIPDAPASISTHVDHASQEILLQHLQAVFPEDGICAEEATPTAVASPRDRKRTWVVDPIDGTRGFARKNGEFSIMVGLTVAGQAVVGVVLEPVISRWTFAQRGGGCWVQYGSSSPQPCRVSRQADVSAAVLVQSRSKPGQPPKAVVQAIQPGRVVETYSAGIKLALVARGEVDCYVNDYRGFHDWDICAGQVLVEEAGGRVSEFNGTPIRYGQGERMLRRGMLASNGLIHEELIRRLASL
jgi:3'(2'), 5'-bisphosphate nucleotidase